MQVATRYDILRGVEANGRIDIPLAEKPVRVATLLNEEQFKALCGAMMHHTTVFLEDQTHDWFWQDGKFRYFSRVAERADVLVAYEVQKVDKFVVDDWSADFKKAHSLHWRRTPALRQLITECFDLAVAHAANKATCEKRYLCASEYLANLRDTRVATIGADDWRVEVYRWLAWHKGFSHLVAWRAQALDR